jgi:hypothetical protein
MSSNDKQYQYFEYESNPEQEQQQQQQQRDMSGFHSLHSYTDASLITSVLLFLLIGTMLVDGLGVFVGVWEAVVLQKIRTGAYETNEILMEAVNSNAMRVRLVGIIQLLVTIVSGIIFLCWTYRVCKNAHSLNMAQQTSTPGWAVGWYFIPIANLWKPCTALREAWLASCHPDLQRENGASLISFWWSIHILCVALGQISMQMARRLGEDAAITQFITLNEIQIAGDVMRLLLNGLTCVIILRFARCQRETHEKMNDDFL